MHALYSICTRALACWKLKNNRTEEKSDTENFLIVMFTVFNILLLFYYLIGNRRD